MIGGFAQPRQGIKLSPANDMLYVTNFQGDRVTKVDPATNELLAQFQGFNRIGGLSISGDGSRLYGANSGDNTISIVDTATGTTVGRVPVGDKPYGAALSPDGSVLLSGDLGSHTLTVVDPTAGGVRGRHHRHRRTSPGDRLRQELDQGVGAERRSHGGGGRRAGDEGDQDRGVAVNPERFAAGAAARPGAGGDSWCTSAGRVPRR